MQQATKKPLYWGEEYLQICVLEFCRMFGRRWNSKWQPTPIFLPGKFHGPQSVGSQRIRYDWATEHARKHAWKRGETESAVLNPSDRLCSAGEAIRAWTGVWWK